jgi:predicted O-methyltransferase YrrM
MLLYLRRQMQQSLLPYTPFLHTPPGHYYSALPAVPDARAAMRAVRRDACTLPGIELRATAQLELLQQLAVLASDAPFGAAPDPDRKRFYYGADNVFFYHADALIVYALLRHYAPARVIEVGSGFSSRAMLDTAHMLPTAPAFTFIEPYPARLLSLLNADEQNRCQILQKPVQQVPLEIFHLLEADDMLFIDSTHVAKIGSDVLHILFHILPHLRKGVIIHFHDVYWPFEYPENWVLVLQRRFENPSKQQRKTVLNEETNTHYGA